jgi:glucosyl-3-phosphoglycerate synthase
VGHDEQETLAHALDQALGAAAVGDRVVFVDSASTDRSVDIARELGVEVCDAPLGKGAAVARALSACRTEWICLIDADLDGAQRNIASVLGDAARSTAADLIVGDFDLTPRHLIATHTIGIWTPFSEALFPECHRRFGNRPLTGFRVLRAGLDWGGLPEDFGVEAHVNVQAALGGASIATVELGWYRGRFRYKPEMAFEIATALLDLAVAHRRLDPALRPRWDEWAQDMVEVLRGWRADPAEQEAFRVTLMAAASRPLPGAA